MAIRSRLCGIQLWPNCRTRRSRRRVRCLPAPAPGAIDFTQQPYFPNAVVPTGPDPYLAYLDVWIRPVTFIEDSNLIDPAVGVDTAGRLQTAWQVKIASVAGATCGSTPWPGPSSGQLSTTTTPNSPSGPCCISDSTGYTGMENQFYRVEIHSAGSTSGGSCRAAVHVPLANWRHV